MKYVNRFVFFFIFLMSQQAFSTQEIILATHSNFNKKETTYALVSDINNSEIISLKNVDHSTKQVFTKLYINQLKENTESVLFSIKKFGIQFNVVSIIPKQDILSYQGGSFILKYLKKANLLGKNDYGYIELKLMPYAGSWGLADINHHSKVIKHMHFEGWPIEEREPTSGIYKILFKYRH